MKGGTADRDRVNAVRYRADRPGGHVESHFLKANSPDGRRALWIKYTILRPISEADPEVVETWAVAFQSGATRFPVGVKITSPISEAEFSADPFRVVHPNATLSSGSASGTIASSDHRIAWSLEFEGAEEPFSPFPWRWMYRAPFPRSKTLTPYPDARCSGTLEVDGDRWSVEDWALSQGHNWGKQHAPAYAWAHCNAWDEGPSDAWFEGVSAKLPLGSGTSPWLSTLAVHAEGETYRFDRPGAMFSRQIAVGDDRWRFRVEQRGAELSGAIHARPSEMAGLHYHNPDGSIAHCLNSKLASGRIVLSRPRGGPIELRSSRIALEVLTMRDDHGVAMIL